MKNYAVIYRVHDEEGYSSVHSMEIKAVSKADAEKRFYDIWQEDDVVITGVLLCNIEKELIK